MDTFPCIRTPAQLKHQQTFVRYVGYIPCYLPIDAELYASDMKRLLCKVEAMQKELSPLELVSEYFIQEIDGCVKEMDLCLTHYLVISFFCSYDVNKYSSRHGARQRTLSISIAN